MLTESVDNNVNNYFKIGLTANFIYSFTNTHEFLQAV
jgi:hypothetical protein